MVTSLSIDVQDLPNREAIIGYTALANDPGSGLLAEAVGNFSLVGDANGEIPIASIEFHPAPVVVGNPATGTIVLNFAEALPDDRYTLTVSDNLTDIAGNKLDGESNAAEPQDPPVFPSGDGNNGGDFVARFTVDSRPELGTWAAGQIWIDTNGNEVFDPENPDYTNRDLTYVMGYAADDIFAGNFGRETADGFDKLAAYGRFGDDFRWLIDLDNDGVADIEQFDPANVNGLPVAGRFDDNDVNGDEVAVVTAFPAEGSPSIWYFDTDHDFLVDTSLTSELRGYPIVGDFDGDGFDDLATWMDNRFQVDLANGVRRGWDGVADYTFGFGFPGVRERPVAADFDQDGFDDFGLWSPDSSGETPSETANWYILVSAGRSVLDRITTDPISGQPVVEFSPSPLGQDWYAHYGNNFAVPVVGNFDPPVVPQTDQPEPIITNVIQIDGTSGADRFEFTAGATPDSWIVKLNGETITVDPTATGLHFVGQGGDDVVIYTGSAGSDVVDLASGRATFDFDGFTLEVSGVSLYSVDTGDGFDEVTLHDTPANEWLVAWTDTASMRSDLTEQVVTGYEKLTAIAANGGQDVALLYDSAGNDTFVGTPERAVMSGEGYSLEAVDFDYAHGMRTQGGNDVARLYDSPGNDILEGRQLYTRMVGDGFFVRAKQFPVVEAYAVAGGMDVASLTDTPGDETFTADPSGAELSGDGYTIRVAGFDYNHGYGRFGGNDVAHLYDTPGDDRVQVMYRFAKIMGTDYFARAKYFKNTQIHTSTGNDTAVVLDTAGNDFFTGSASDFKLVTPKETFQGFGFDDVNAIAKYGGQDVAFLLDSAGDDTFVGEGSIGQMSGDGYHLRAAAFEYIHAYSRSGHDVAYLKGTSGADTLNARSTYATLVGSNYFLRAKAFDVLYAEGGEGNDVARLFGTAGNETVVATRSEIMMQGDGFTHRTNGFESVFVNGAGGTDQASSDGATVGGQYEPSSLNADQITQLAVLLGFDRLEAKNVPPQQTNEVHEAVDAVFSLYWEN
ncbi:MAG: hypothetical protein D6741_18670 [Planctomycetota bacterium]|nr:MAG: hypothetical protein D6741_18670 [Planctomycetota bacterium]